MATVKRDVAALDKADGRTIGVDGVWKKARPVVLGGDWDKATAAALDVVAQAGNGSNLILDPDLDSYYVMDTLVTKLPARPTARARVPISTRRAAMDDRIALARRRCADSTDAAMETGLQTAFAETARRGLKPALATPLAALDDQARRRDDVSASERSRRPPRRGSTRCSSRAWTSTARRATGSR